MYSTTRNRVFTAKVVPQKSTDQIKFSFTMLELEEAMAQILSGPAPIGERIPGGCAAACCGAGVAALDLPRSITRRWMAMRCAEDSLGQPNSVPAPRLGVPAGGFAGEVHRGLRAYSGFAFAARR
jgi:hypothetical protein